MASASFSPFGGPMFKVIAGLAHKYFLVHVSILTKSDRLRAVVEGGWKERSERKVVLEDWDEETVGRLVEWLYTGDYSSPRPIRFVYNTAAVNADVRGALDGPEITPVASLTPEDFLKLDLGHQGIGLDANKASITDKGIRPQPLTPLAEKGSDHFTKNFHESSTKVLDRWLRSCKHDPHELDLEATLLAHAKVYSLANYMLLADLQALAFQNLDSVFTWIDSRIIAKSPTVSNLVMLVRYVYGNTNRPKTREEPLRGLLTTLIAKNFGCFDDGEEGKVRRLMDEGGDFGTDLWEKVSRHMGVLRKDLEESHQKIASLETETIGTRNKRRRGGILRG